MTTEVTITGTGTPLATHDRAGPGVLIKYGDMHLQFDVGRATVPRLLAADSSPMALTAVFLTHYHSDHVVGLQDLVLSQWTMDVYDEAVNLPIVAPNGTTVNFCEHMLDIWQDDLEVRSLENKRAPHPKIEVIGFDATQEPSEVWSNGDVRVLAGQVRHEPVVDAVGYRIETPDGVIAISGDTSVCDEVAALAKDADVVVYEAMRMDVIAERPVEKQYIMHYHADTRLIGKQMAELAVPKLLLTHLIPAPMNEAEEQPFIDDVREGGYQGEVMVCSDLDTVVLP